MSVVYLYIFTHYRGRRYRHLDRWHPRADAAAAAAGTYPLKYGRGRVSFYCLFSPTRRRLGRRCHRRHYSRRSDRPILFLRRASSGLYYLLLAYIPPSPPRCCNNFVLTRARPPSLFPSRYTNEIRRVVSTPRGYTRRVHVNCFLV